MKFKSAVVIWFIFGFIGQSFAQNTPSLTQAPSPLTWASVVKKAFELTRARETDDLERLQKDFKDAIDSVDRMIGQIDSPQEKKDAWDQRNSLVVGAIFTQQHTYAPRLLSLEEGLPFLEQQNDFPSEDSKAKEYGQALSRAVRQIQIIDSLYEKEITIKEREQGFITLMYIKDLFESNAKEIYSLHGDLPKTSFTLASLYNGLLEKYQKESKIKFRDQVRRAGFDGVLIPGADLFDFLGVAKKIEF